ncbi:MAG TPA: hypothetical protein VGE62_00915 [Candidatus Paceibacterota bacterium]
MDITLFLAQIYGPVLLAVGAGVFVSTRYYVKIYRDLDKDALAVLVFGMFGMAIGIVQVSFHNVWDTFLQGLISFIGWGFIAKGALFLIAPGIVDRMGDEWANRKLVPLAGFFMVLIGAYLTWAGYFA